MIGFANINTGQRLSSRIPSPSLAVFLSIVNAGNIRFSTLAQLYPASVLGEDKFASVTFYHHSLIKSQGNIKLSKSAGDPSILGFRQQNTPPDDIYGHIRVMLQINAPLTK
jgi:hypothetical protein